MLASVLVGIITGAVIAISDARSGGASSISWTAVILVALIVPVISLVEVLRDRRRMKQTH